MSKTWVLLSTRILHDVRWGVLPDSEWRKCIESIISNPDNQHYDYLPGRHEWNKVRKYAAPEVFQRDGRVCKKCGSTERLEIDHIIPIAKGGSSDLWNLQVLCKTCNIKKGAKIL